MIKYILSRVLFVMIVSIFIQFVSYVLPDGLLNVENARDIVILNLLLLEIYNLKESSGK